jgi:predicted ATPase/DNA-binding SARP family transcriptional activator/DNA-binding CsgD family transcriptional regulator
MEDGSCTPKPSFLLSLRSTERGEVAGDRPTTKVQSNLESTSGRGPEVVRVKVLGGFWVSVGPRTIEDNQWRLRKAAALVKLLALAPSHRLHREQAMDLLWSDSSRKAASNNLRQALHAARRALHPAPASPNRYLSLQDEQLILCLGGPLWVDFEAFEEAAATARRSRDPAAYRVALDLYAGELLPADRYEEWVENRRGGLRRLHLALLVELAGLYEQSGEYGPAVEALRRAVTEEPTNEGAHAGLMRLYTLSGQRQSALGQYERLRETLARELSAEPAATTRQLRDEIAAGRLPLSLPTGPLQDEPLAADRHNLPATRTSFVGREQEMLEVRRTLAMTRLLTLTGAGGSGKTRLALEVARDLVTSYPDGVWLVELAPLTEGELVPQAVARVLGVREHPGRLLTGTLVEALREKIMLLVLDNCEHLADSVARLLDTLLDSCPRLRVLATSRETLNVEGEAVRRVSSLSVPDTDRLLTAVELTRYDAVRLFLARVQLRLRDFNLTPENGRAVAEICRGLEGIPLAIELATARVGTLSMEQISERLRDPLGLLSAGGRTAVPRHRTLRGTLDWSYELLSKSDRSLLARLSVFAGGWTLEAAEAIGAGDGIEEGEILDLISRLVNKSLVVAEGTGNGALHYKMLEPVRQYAREKLEESGEAEAVLRRHAAFFLTLAERTEPEVKGERQEERLVRLEREHDNLRAALGWSFSQGEPELGLRLAVALWEFWDTHGHLSEGRGWLERGIAVSGPTMTRTRARALNGAGWIALFQGDHRAAQVLVEKSLALYRGLEDKEGIASALANLGFIAVLGQQNLASVPALLEETVELRPEVRDRHTVAYLLIFEGLVVGNQFVEEGRLGVHVESLATRYRALHEQSMALFREIGDARGMGICLTNLALGELILGNYGQATTLLRELLHQSRKLDDKLHTQYAFFGLAGVTASQGQLLRATRLWAIADTVRETSGIQLPAFTRSSMDYEGRLAAVRAELGEEVFEKAWEEGRAMTLGEAVEYALSEEEAATPSSPARQQPSAGTRAVALTRREEEVAVLVARGLTNRQIASNLSISEHTVATHVARIIKKLELNSRSQLAAWVTEQGLPPSDSV